MALTGVRAETQVVAHVLNVTGQWRLEAGASPVAAGLGLAAGAKIVAVSNHPGDAITLVRDEDMSRMWTGCDASGTNPCRNPVVVAGVSTGDAAGGLKGLVDVALAVLLSKPPAINSHYATALSRGDEKLWEMEAVVELDPAQGIVLPPAPADMPTGQYMFSVAKPGEKAAATQTVQLSSDGTWRALRCDAPGLYEISIANGDGEQVADALILAVPESKYKPRRDEFAELKQRAEEWTGPGARADGHLFLRAYLVNASLAAGSQP